MRCHRAAPALRSRYRGEAAAGAPARCREGARGAARAVPHRSVPAGQEGPPPEPPPPLPYRAAAAAFVCLSVRPPRRAPPVCPPVLTCPLALAGSVAAAWPLGGAVPSALAALEPWLPMVRHVGPDPAAAAAEREWAEPPAAPLMRRGRGRDAGDPAPGAGDGDGATAPAGPGGVGGAVPPPRLCAPGDRSSPRWGRGAGSWPPPSLHPWEGPVVPLIPTPSPPEQSHGAVCLRPSPRGTT